MNRTGRGVLCNKPASGTEVIQEYGEQHQKTGQVDRLHVRRLGVPDRRARGDDPARGAVRRAAASAREILTGKHAVGRVIARPFIGDAGALRAHAEPARLLARAAAAELPDRDPRRGPHDLRRREDQRHLRRAATSTSPSRRSRTSTASTARSSCSRTSTTGFVFTNLVETDQLWGHRNDPVNFHRCLQDFDRRLPDILEALRDGDLLDHHVRPRLRPDDAVERPLARARDASRVRGRDRTPPGAIHEDGEFGDVGATVSAWLGAKHPARARRARRSSSDEPRRPRGRSRPVRDRDGARGAALFAGG